MGGVLPWLAGLAGLGGAYGSYKSGQAQDQNNKANLAFQQQKQQAMMNLLGPMFQGQASPYQNRLNQMLGMPQSQGMRNPWQGLTGSTSGGPQYSPSGQPLQAPKPGQTLPPQMQYNMMSSGPDGMQTPGSNWQNIDPNMFNPGGSAYNPGTQAPIGGYGGMEKFGAAMTDQGGGGFDPSKFGMANDWRSGADKFTGGLMNSVQMPQGGLPSPVGDPMVGGGVGMNGGWESSGMGGGSQGFTNDNGLGYTSGQYDPGNVDFAQGFGTDAQSQGYGSQQIDINNLLGKSGSMVGQDGLYQMLNRDPAGQMVNAQDLIGANTNLFNRQTDRSAQLLNGRARGLGQFAGSASANAEAQLRGDANAQLGQQNANLLYQTATGNADRGLNLYGQQLGGWGQLGGLGNSGADILLRGSMSNQGAADQAGQFGAGAFNQASQYNAGQRNNMSQFNAGNYNATQQFNANNRNQANQFNIGNQNQANQFGINAYMQALLSAQGMGQQQQSNNINLASIFGGLPIPQGQAGGNAWSNIGESSMMPWILAMANQKPATKGP